MKRTMIVGLIIIAGLIGFTALGDNGSTNNVSNSPVATTLQPNTRIFDVRTVEEYNQSRVETATLLPLADIQSGKLPDVPKDSPIAVYCRSGNRSAEATAILKSAGYTNVTDMGGLSDVNRYGLAATTPEQCDANC